MNFQSKPNLFFTSITADLFAFRCQCHHEFFSRSHVVSSPRQDDRSTSIMSGEFETILVKRRSYTEHIKDAKLHKSDPIT